MVASRLVRRGSTVRVRQRALQKSYAICRACFTWQYPTRVPRRVEELIRKCRRNDGRILAFNRPSAARRAAIARSRASPRPTNDFPGGFSDVDHEEHIHIGYDD
jgi:hypothetical protein